MVSPDAVSDGAADRDRQEGTGSGSGDLAPHEAVPQPSDGDEGPGSRFDELARAAKRDAGPDEEPAEPG